MSQRQQVKGCAFLRARINGFLAGLGAFGILDFLGGLRSGLSWDFVILWPLVFVLRQCLLDGVVGAWDGVSPLI